MGGEKRCRRKKRKYLINLEQRRQPISTKAEDGGKVKEGKKTRFIVSEGRKRKKAADAMKSGRRELATRWQENPFSSEGESLSRCVTTKKGGERGADFERGKVRFWC